MIEEYGPIVLEAVEERLPPTPPPIQQWICYTANGEIIRRESGPGDPYILPETTLLEVDDVWAISPETHKVVNGRVVEKTAEEKYQYQLPQFHEVHTAALVELQQTIETQLDDYPISDDERARWRVYRAHLRRLSDWKDPVAMVESWPDRPDKQDRIAHLRARIKRT